ncbi:MAG: deoxynucleoside kinase [Chloroflexi bacterium]|nr:deoxynucleoside kinase [Chloroflexota bacterium]
MANSYVAIEGVIGVGKTTLARLVTAALNANLLLEVFDENPFLPLFYQDRQRYAFQTQLFFLLNRFQQQRRQVPVLLRCGPLVSDYTFAKDRLFAALNLSGDELALYDQVYTILAQRTIKPDLLIYIHADTDVIMQRITLRDRAYERSMEWIYIDQLRRAYNDFIQHYQDSPVISLDTNNLNFLTDKEVVEDIIQRIRAELHIGPFQPSLFS